MRDVEEAARRDRRARLLAAGVAGYDDPEIFALVDAVLHRAIKRDKDVGSVLELLADDGECRLETALSLSSHRPIIGPVILFVKRRLLLPLTRWLFEYTRENFRRQQCINQLLAASIEELAIENARLRREIAGSQNGRIAERKG